MKRLRRPRLGILIAALAILGIPAGGVAYAYWTSTGSGSGTGTSGTTVPVTLSAATPTFLLYPGGATGVTLTVSNSNGAALQLGSLSLDTSQGTGGFSVDGAHSGCVLSALSFTTQNNSGAGWAVPKMTAGVNGSLLITLPNALAMAANAANACQGAAFTVYLVAGP